MKHVESSALDGGSHNSKADSVIVLGGGIAGLAAAEMLSGQGAKVTLLEASEQLGGMHRSVSIGPYHFDYGSIFYEPNAKLLAMVPGIADSLPQIKRVQRRILPDGGLGRYPFDVASLLRGSKRQVLRSALSMLAARLRPGRAETLEAASTQRLGRVFLRESGLYDYMLHFNGLPPDQIDRAFFDERMRFVAAQTRLRRLWRLLLRRRVPPPVRPPLYIRPREGYGPIFDALAERLRAQGVEIRTGQAVEAVEGPPGALKLRCGEQVYSAAQVVGAMPLDALHRMVFGTPSGLRSLDLLSLYVSAEWLDPDCGNVLFNFHKGGGWKRLTVYSQLYPDPQVTRAFFTVEITLSPDSTVTAEEGFARFAEHLEGLGLARGLVLEGGQRHPGAYPFYSVGYAEQAKAARDRLAAAGITMVGRQGRFEYLPTSSGVIRRTQEELRKN